MDELTVRQEAGRQVHRTSRMAVVRWCVLLLALVVAAGCARTPEDGVRPHGVPAAAQPATVTTHVDGDTVRVTAPAGGDALEEGVETKVRLLEIDAPESVHPDKPVECHAVEAGEALAELLPLGSTAWALPDEELQDRYGRTLLYLWNDEGVFVNEQLVADGHAEAVLYEPNDRYIDRMRAAESRARAAAAGLWGECAVR
jgi:micrococcal nuclease